MGKDFAPGLPKKEEVGDISKLREGDVVDFIVQEHLAEKAGRHYDVRIGLPSTGLFSWATKKELPKPGERRALFQQPLHRHEYGKFEGEIEEGYGKGTVRKHEEGKVLITKVSPSALHMTVTHRKAPERLVLVRPRPRPEDGEPRKKGDGKQWLLINTTPTKAVEYRKVHYAKIPPEKAEGVLEKLQPGSSVQAKVDGAASLTKLLDDKAEVLSYRVAKRTGHPIVHTERLFGGAPVRVSIPKKYVGSVLRGELYGMKGKKVVPPQELGGLLNASVSKSMTQQKERGINLKNMIFDIQSLGSKSTKELPYEKRLELVREVLEHLPSSHFHAPEEARTPSAAKELLRKVESGRHPLTEEGIVIHRPEAKPAKVKFTEERDVYVTGIFPGKGRLAGRGAGGFRYSRKPGGPTVGEVGTGFSDETRRAMHRDPDSYVGRVARVRAQSSFKSGALRAPSLIAFHEDYPMKKTSAFSLALASAIAELYSHH